MNSLADGISEKWDPGPRDVRTRDPGLGTRDLGLGTRDPGLGTRDSGLGTRDSGLGTRDSNYYNNDLTLPVYASGNTVSCETKAVVELLVRGKLPENLIATATPVYIKKNVEFVVDTSNLGDWRDVKHDMIVGMSRTGTKTYYFASIDNDFEAADKEAHDFKATRFVYCHK